MLAEEVIFSFSFVCVFVCLSVRLRSHVFTQATLCTTTMVYGVLVHHQGAICTTKAQYAPCRLSTYVCLSVCLDLTEKHDRNDIRASPGSSLSLWYWLVDTRHYPIIPCLFIDRVALAKQGDNRIGSVRLSVRPSVCLSSLFWFVMHGRYASFYVNKGMSKLFQQQFCFVCTPWRVYSYPFVYIKWSISPMHCIIKTHRQKAWDDGVAPSVDSHQHQFAMSSWNLC